MSWQLAFISNECESITVNINNESLKLDGLGEDGKTWVSKDGTCRKTLPPKWKDLVRINVEATAKPEDSNATLYVIWDGKVKKIMNFDDEESQDVKAESHPPFEDKIPIDTIPEK